MAIYTHSHIAEVSVNGATLSPHVTSVQLSQKRKVDEVEVLGNAPVVKVVGPPSKQIKLKGLMEPTVDAELQARYDAGDVVLWTFTPQGTGQTQKTGACIVSDYNPDTDGSKAAMWDATLEVVDASQLVSA